MNKSGDLKSPLGQLTSIPKKTSEQLVKEPLEVVKEAEVQAGAKSAASSASLDIDKQGNASSSNKDTLEVVKKMYEQSEHKVSTPSDEIISKVIEENPKETPEEIQKLAATRQQLWQQQHTTSYFEPTFNPSKKQEEPRPAEQIEKEKQEKKQMEALELQKEEKKKEELAPSVKQGTVERNPGASG